jgi:aspartyl aminopeptidase
MNTALALAATLCFAGLAAAQDSQIIKDRQNLCQISVPSDWTPDKLVHSMAASPDKKNGSVVSAMRAGASYQQTVAVAKSTYSVTKTVEESDARTILVYANRNGKPGGGIYVATGGSQICVATVDFGDPAFESHAQKMAASVKVVK